MGLEKLSPESPLQLKTKYMFQSVFFCEYVWWHNRVNPMSYRPQKYGYSRCTFGALPRVRASQIRHHVSPGFPPTSSKTGRLGENYIRRVSKNKKFFSKLKITCFFFDDPRALFRCNLLSLVLGSLVLNTPGGFNTFAFFECQKVTCVDPGRKL